jgi:hypothetical protein
VTGACDLTSESVAELIRPTLDAFVSKADPFIRKVTEEIYEQLLYTVQDYLRENGEWNIGQEIERCRQIERDNTQLRLRNNDVENALRGLTGILNTAESNASGNPEWDVVSTRVTYARHVMGQSAAIQQAKQEQG